jgi:histone acetyltransferase (RNA polymerase elongator complex component)
MEKLPDIRINRRPFIVPVFIPHAGCPHRCVFCNQSVTTGQKNPFPSENDISQTILQFLSFRRKTRPWTEISFYGGNFLGLAPERVEHLLSIASRFVEQGQADGIRFSTRPDTISSQTLARLAGYPVTTVEVGVQSMNDRVLDHTRRGHRVSHTLRAATLLKTQTTYRLGLQMMIGLPGDTFLDALETGRQIAACEPDFVRIYPTLVLKGSLLAQWFDQGIYVPLSLEAAVDLTKSLYCIFAKKNIRVIRMGLQPTAELNPEADVLAGPFHPAFGELVLAALWREALTSHFQQAGTVPGIVSIQAHSRAMSRIRGLKNANLNNLKTRFQIDRIDMITNDALFENTAIINDMPCRLTYEY